MRRQSTRLFEQRNSFATLRDLFRWAQREAVGYQALAENGYMLLAERVRRDEEKLVVKEVIEKVMKVKIDEDTLYTVTEPALGLIWTKAMRRLYTLVSRALVNNEPVLLVGETGCGKTSVCQLLAEKMGKELHVINAHQNTETGDIIGGQRPYRDRLRYQSQLITELREFFQHRPETNDMALDDLAEEFGKLDVENLTPEMSENANRIRDTFSRQKILFEWVDGALVQAMKRGEPFLLDEISLADDSVLERLNSVLESSRSIVLAEKGGEDVHIMATDGFQFFATMNPGGDYGKKELSPALRNRFTEIWVPAVGDRDDLLQIVQAQLTVNAASSIVDFAEWFTKRMGGSAVSIRDILAWVQVINVTHSLLGMNLSLFHGAMMVYVDGIGTTSGTEFLDVAKEKVVCIAFLSELLRQDFASEYLSPVLVKSTAESFSLGHFTISRGESTSDSPSFSFRAPTTAANGMKVLRAMQLPKSILLEGAPGIGKTSLISAIAAAAAHPLTRINLSDQTDLMDLFGSDVPVDRGRGGEFAWRDAPFLRAMQNGGWVLLDELNLASQSVLEGLNACLDHRGTAYIPELDRSFTRHPEFRIFAAQNPHSQGGGRKGLPKSFVNRFTVVHVESLTLEDMYVIGHHLYPTIDEETVRKLISFVMTMQQDADSPIAFASLGRPWEFNLRDVLKWLELVHDQDGLFKGRTAGDYLHLVVSQRLRTAADKIHLASIFERELGPLSDMPSAYSLGEDTFRAGMAVAPRKQITAGNDGLPVALQHLHSMEVLTLCIQKGWPCILVGPSGSGKTSLIRSLASTSGAKLHEFSMNGDTDATDLIGGYEQRDINRQISQIADALREMVSERLALEGPMNSLLSDIIELLSMLPCTGQAAAAVRTRLLEIVSIADAEMSHLIDALVGYLPDIDDNGSGKFQWYNGILVDVITRGDWIILDNANLCNPSVLDRLNSLLEPDGALILHESSQSNGEPRVVKPHPNFRLFLTMDPRYGELSRAMRNRAVEVAMEPQNGDYIYSASPTIPANEIQWSGMWLLSQVFNLFNALFNCFNLDRPILASSLTNSWNMRPFSPSHICKTGSNQMLRQRIHLRFSPSLSY